MLSGKSFLIISVIWIFETIKKNQCLPESIFFVKKEFWHKTVLFVGKKERLDCYKFLCQKAGLSSPIEKSQYTSSPGSRDFCSKQPRYLGDRLLLILEEQIKGKLYKNVFDESIACLISSWGM